MMIFSKELFLKEKLTGNKLIDDILLNLEWLDKCDGREVIKVKKEWNKYDGGKYEYKLKNSYRTYLGRFKLKINKNWIIEEI